MGFLATSLSDQALAMNAAEPVRITLSSDDELAFVHGQPQQEIGHLGGRLGRNMAYTRFYDWPPANQSARWTVDLTAGQAQSLRIRAGCPRAGFVEATLSIDADGTVSIAPAAAAAGRSATP